MQEKVKNRLPRRPRLRFGELTLIPATDPAGYVIDDMWKIPGGETVTTAEVRRRGDAIGVTTKVLTE